VRPDSYVRVRSYGSSQLSAAQWRRWFVLARPAAAVVSERWVGPNVGPSVARIPRVSLSSRARSLSLSLSLSLCLSLALTPHHRELVAKTNLNDRISETKAANRRVSIDVTQQPRSEPRRRRRRRLRGRSQQSRSITPLARGAARGRPIVLTNLPAPPIQERRTATITKEYTKVKFYLRTTGEKKKKKCPTMSSRSSSACVQPTPDSQETRYRPWNTTGDAFVFRGVETTTSSATLFPPPKCPCVRRHCFWPLV